MPKINYTDSSGNTKTIDFEAFKESSKKWGLTVFDKTLKKNKGLAVFDKTS